MWMMFHINAANAFKNYWQSCKWMMEVNLVYLSISSGCKEEMVPKIILPVKKCFGFL